MKASELPEGLGELEVYALEGRDFEYSGRKAEMFLIHEDADGGFVCLEDLLAWARPLQAKLEAAEALLDDMREVGERLGTQDNRITSDPIFMVQEQKRTYGVSEDYTYKHVWIDPDDCEAGVLDGEEEGAEKVGYTSHWESIQACLTEVGAQAFIDRKAHNHGPLRIYVASAYYNAEWRLIRGVFARAAGLGQGNGIKCITFDKAAQDAIPESVRLRMDADRARAEGQGGSDGE